VPEDERVANRAAANFCVPDNELSSFIARKSPYYSEKDVLGFAKRLQVHPGIVVGRFQFHTQRYDFLRRFQVKISQFVTPSADIDGWGCVFPVSI